MNIHEQVSLVRQFMLQVAPEVARHCLQTFAHIPPADLDEARDIRRRIARCCSETTLEMASYLAGSYAQFEDETKEATQTVPAAQAGQPQAGGAAAPVQLSEAELPSEESNLPPLREGEGDPGASQARSRRRVAQ